MKCITPHVLGILLAVMPATTASFGQERLTEDDLIGEWILPANGAVIRAYRCGDGFCGSDIKVKSPRLLENGPRRHRPGIFILSNLQKTGRTSWHGEFYNIRDGDTYEGTLNLIDKNRLNFIRCIIDSVLCETLTFHRIDPPRQPQKREHRAVSADQLKATPPLPGAKPAVREPTMADFKAFLKERGISGIPSLIPQEKQALFREFMAWRSKR